jgi:hypothetical protein
VITETKYIGIERYKLMHTRCDDLISPMAATCRWGVESGTRVSKDVSVYSSLRLNTVRSECQWYTDGGK